MRGEEMEENTETCEEGEGDSDERRERERDSEKDG